MKILMATTALMATLAFQHAQASIIEYELNDLGGQSYEYVYNVSNDTLGGDLVWFTIYFSNLATNLAVSATTPGGWDPIVIQQDPGLPDSGFYDALALGQGIEPDASLGGFSVTFDWGDLSSLPDSQYFTINAEDAFTGDFIVLDDGNTVPTQVVAPNPVPEPNGLALIALALSAFGFRSRLRT